jgi:hypothetical protein
MNKSVSFFRFERYCKRKADSQAALTKYYGHLFGEPPSKNCILSYNGEDGAVVFDGYHWRELDMKTLVQESSGSSE